MLAQESVHVPVFYYNTLLNNLRNNRLLLAFAVNYRRTLDVETLPPTKSIAIQSIGTNVSSIRIELNGAIHNRSEHYDDFF